MNDTITVFVLALIAGAATNAIMAAMEPGNLLAFWGRFLNWLSLKKRIGHLAAPLGHCVWCFGLWFGGLFLAGVWALGGPYQCWYWPVMCLATPTFAALFYKYTLAEPTDAKSKSTPKE